MKILFIYPNIVKYPKGISHGIGLLSAVLKEEGHKTSLIDVTFGMSDAQILKETKEFEPDLIAFSAGSNNIYYAEHIATLLKKEFKIPTIVGGCHPTIDSLKTLQRECFDMVCIGEGEFALLDLVKTWENGEQSYKIENIWFKKDGEIIQNPIRPLVNDLNSLPFTDLDIFDYGRYLKWQNHVATFISAKGCPFDCTYCINRTLRNLYKGKGRFVRFRSVDHLLAEIKEVISKYRVNGIEFYDDTFTLKKDRVKEFCEKYPAQIKLPFDINARVGTVTKEIFKSLKKAGCRRVAIGVEAGDPYIRNEILKRDMTDEEILETFAWAKEAGLETYTYNMIGIPYETRESVNRTIQLNCRIKPNYVNASIFNAYKGTELYNLCLQNGWLKEPEARGSYSLTTNLSHPNFSLDELVRMRNSFGFQCFIKRSPLRALADLIDCKLDQLPYYPLIRSTLLTNLRKIGVKGV